MKVLVTGATGFLGGWLVRRLLQEKEGCQIRVLARSANKLEELDGLPLEVQMGDVTDLSSLLEGCRGVDTVFHLAGLIAYTPAQREAMEKVNVEGTANVIAACEQMKVRKLVYLSSVVAIGASFDGKRPLIEESSYNIGHLHLGYFETKHKAENLVRNAVAERRIDAVMINPSTIYGAGDAKKGSRGTQLKVARGKLPFYTSGGVGIVAVEDVLEAIIAVWKKGAPGERYIINSENILLKDLFELIASKAGVKPPKIFLPNPVVKTIGLIGDGLEAIGKKGPLTSENAWTAILFHWFDSSKARRELGLKFRPAEYSIEQSLKWSRDHGLLNP